MKVILFGATGMVDQGLLQVLQASVTGLEPQRAYVLALSPRPDGGGSLEPLAVFTTNPRRDRQSSMRLARSGRSCVERTMCSAGTW